MSTYSSIRDAIKTAVSGVSNIGTVQSYERYAADWTNYLAEYAATVGGQKQIRGWWVTLDPAGGIRPAEPYSMANIRRTYQFLVRGIMGLHDSANTETTFYDLVEAVMNVIDAKKDFSLAAVIDYSIGPCAATRLGWTMAGSVLCHYAEITVPVEVEVAVSFA